jgi:acrylyl-CoA reductase (NADPH)
MLARLLGQLKYGASVAVVGNASGTAVPANVIPFLLRGINMLGIDSAAQPYANRVRAWDRITSDLPLDKLDAMMTEATLEDLPSLGRDIQNGKIKGRVVVDVNK